MPSLIATVTNDLSQDQRMHRICGSLARAGYSVTLVGRELPHSLPLTEQPYQQHRIPCRHLHGKRFYWEYNQKLTRYLKQQRPDIINSVDLDTLWAGYRAARKTGAKLVYDAHEYFSETPEVVGRKLVQTAWRRLARWLIPRADLCYTVGPALAKEFQRVHKRKFGVVRNLPYRRTDQLKEPPPGPKILLYQGMLNQGRGLYTLLDAMVELPNYELWMAGNGDLETELRAYADQIGIDDRIRWLGFVPPAELPAITRQAYLGFNLLIPESASYYFSLANKTFDYIQAGLPAFHMHFPEYLQLDQEYGGIILQGRLYPEAIVYEIQELERAPARYLQLRQACLQAAEELCWEKEEGRLLGYYEGL